MGIRYVTQALGLDGMHREWLPHWRWGGIRYSMYLVAQADYAVSSECQLLYQYCECNSHCLLLQSYTGHGGGGYRCCCAAHMSKSRWHLSGVAIACVAYNIKWRGHLFDKILPLVVLVR